MVSSLKHIPQLSQNNPLQANALKNCKNTTFHRCCNLFRIKHELGSEETCRVLAWRSAILWFSHHWPTAPHPADGQLQGTSLGRNWPVQTGWEPVLSNRVAHTDLWLLKFQFIQFKENWFLSHTFLNTFQVLNSHRWLVAIALDGTDIEHFHLSHEVQLDLEGSF